MNGALDTATELYGIYKAWEVFHSIPKRGLDNLKLYPSIMPYLQHGLDLEIFTQQEVDAKQKEYVDKNTPQTQE